MSPGTAVSAPGSSGSPPGLPGESFRLLCFEHLCLRSDVFDSFFSLFKTLLMLHGADDASASHPGSPGSTFVLPGKSFRPFVFELSLTCPDMVCSFIDHFLSCLSHPGAPDVSIWALVHSMSQLEAALLFPLSSTLGDLVCHCTGLSGGLGGSGESYDSFVSHSQH